MAKVYFNLIAFLAANNVYPSLGHFLSYLFISSLLDGESNTHGS